MDDIAKGLDILKDTVLNNRRHQDYDRVVKYADKCRKLFTGEDCESLLRQFAKREDEALFQQRKDIFQSVMPAVANNLDKVFIKPIRSGRVYSSVDTEDDEKREEIITAIQNFYQGKSESGVDAFERTRWFDLVKHDPNAFIAVEFEPFDPKVEKAKPFPLEYSSAEAINYQFKRGVLEWFIGETRSQYKKRATKSNTGTESSFVFASGNRYIMYLDNHAIELVEVDPEDKITDIEHPLFTKIGARMFVIQTYEPKSKGVPLIRVGFEEDTNTKGRTCLSIFHAAIPFFMKELKSGSELDLTMSLHAFPQKLQYAQRCNGDKDRGIPPCRNGISAATGATCPACNGSGMAQVHTSSQDVILVPYPKDGDQLFDLDKLMVYKSPDVALVQFQDEYVDRLTEKARKAIFGGTTLIQKSGLKTATEADYAMDDIYDTLHPFAAQYSRVWLFLVEKICVFTDNDNGVTLYHKFPNDFKLKSLTELFNERKAAVDAGLPQHVIDAIDIDIQEILYADDQDTLTKIKIKSKFQPFSGKSASDVQLIISTGKTTKFYEFLYTHFEIIFNDIDNNEGDEFYLLSYEKQLALIKKKVDALIAEIDVDKYAKMPIPIEGDQGGGSGNALKDSVGG